MSVGEGSTVTATHEARTEQLTAAADDGDRLSRQTAKLRSRASVPIDRWFQRFGAVLMSIGILAIVGGWYGVAHTARQWRQTPYIMSGGVLGLALVIAGGFAYYGYWLTRLVEQSQKQAAILDRLASQLGAGPAFDADDDEVVLAAGILHRATCPLLAGQTDITRPTGRERKVRGCPVCEAALASK